MLRQALSKLQQAIPSSNTRLFSAAPSVYDKLVQITVLDREGRRHVMRGYEGQTVMDVLMASELDDALALSPEGRGNFDAHVKIPNDLQDKIPAPVGDDKDELRELADSSDLDAGSRLASRIVLTSDLSGLTVAVGALRSWKSL